MENATKKTDHRQSEVDLLSGIPLPALAFCLLWWLFLNPVAYTRAKAISNLQLQTRLYRAMLWLISTLLIGFSIIPVLGLTLGLAPSSESLFPPHILLLILSGVWLVSLLYLSDDLLSPMRAIAIGFVAFFVAFIANATLCIALVLIFSAALFAVFEDDLLSAPSPDGHRRQGIFDNTIAMLFALPIIVSMILAFPIFAVKSGAALPVAVFCFNRMKASVKQQQRNRISILLFAGLPIAYAALIWIYWFGGWGVLSGIF